MKFKIERSKFLEGLKSVQNIVVGKGSLPILGNVMISAVGKELTMTTTDLDISIKSTVECNVLESGASTLPVKLLSNLVSKAGEGEIEVETDAYIYQSHYSQSEVLLHYSLYEYERHSQIPAYFFPSN